MRYFLLAAVGIAALFTSCEFSVSTNTTPKKPTTAFSTTENSGPLTGALVKNDIELDASHVKVRQAYLTDANGTLLDKNEAKVGDKVKCVVLLDTGWTKYDGKSFIGASEKIMTESGVVFLDAQDVFADYTTTGIKADDAGAISLSAMITRKEPGIDNYKVQFRIWDKKGNGEVTGRYKLKVSE